MKNTSEKLLSVILAVGIASSAFTACAGQQNAADSSSENSVKTTQATNFNADQRVKDSKKDKFAKYKEPITLTAMTGIAPNATSTNYANSKWSKLLSEKFNINIKYVDLAVNGDQYNQKVSLMLSSGSMPDLVNLSLAQMTQAKEADLLADMTSPYYDYVSEQAYTSMIADGKNPLKAATFDGKLYGIPSVDPSLESCHALFYNAGWCKKLGLSAPTDWTSFEKMIYAFSKSDFAGNGKKTYGIGLTKYIWDTGFEATSIANAMGAYPNAWIAKNGSVVYGSVQPEMKQVLTKLHQYYKDGLIDPEFVNKTFDVEGKLVATKQLGAMFGAQWTGLMADNCMESYYQNSKNPDSEDWEVAAIPSYTSGGTTKPIIYDESNTWLCASASCKHPEAATIICNYMHYMGQGPQAKGPEGHPELKIDYATWTDLWNNDTYRIYSPGTEHANIARWDHWNEALKEGDKADTSWIDNNYLAFDQYYQMKDFQKYGSKMVGKHNDKLNRTYTMADAAWQFTYKLCGQTFMYAEQCKKNNDLVNDVQGSFVSDTMVEKQASLHDYELQTFTKMITGQTSVDDFDNFVKQWNAMGGTQITKEMNTYYKSKQS